MIGPFSQSYRKDFATFMKISRPPQNSRAIFDLIYERQERERQAISEAHLKTPQGEAERQNRNLETVKRMREETNIVFNSDCDGSGPHSCGEIRILPITRDSNAVVCHACYRHEMAFRLGITANGSLPVPDLPSWESLKVYEGEKKNGYDYVHQAWVVNGRYQDCGHPNQNCGCFGRIHQGEHSGDSLKV